MENPGYGGTMAAPTTTATGMPTSIHPLDSHVDTGPGPVLSTAPTHGSSQVLAQGTAPYSTMAPQVHPGLQAGGSAQMPMMNNGQGPAQGGGAYVSNGGASYEDANRPTILQRLDTGSTASLNAEEMPAHGGAV